MDKVKLWLRNLVPSTIAAALWLNGWVYPLIVLPLLYVWFVRKDFGWIGFQRARLAFSALLGVASALVTILVWHLLSLHCMPQAERSSTTPYVLFTDVIWYPFYEEIAYRGFILAHLSVKGRSFSRRNTGKLGANFAFPLRTPQIHNLSHPIYAGTCLFLGVDKRINILGNKKHIRMCFVPFVDKRLSPCIRLLYWIKLKATN